MDSTPVEYRGCELSAIVRHLSGEFVATLLIERPGGTRRAIGPFRSFPTAQAAENYAIQYGKAELDGRLAERGPRVAMAER
ncbi:MULTISPECIES: hypothetical protein [unclassified Caballeronia]|uniref:hypothetical protein n=1 Tax=unclassified Caballeronia TaxID=2646786 RepID=UPI00285E9D0A|nr:MULTISPECIES: hypothetical protein [unclassified Caballeronia]MDR5817909.1 hypothetical protein [Caballeronia sp. LZ033]MDR5824870.1 hypothetical protein [Caballeronia sp. LZ043]MDR5838674.1 hypothetical protein [Caballeronia sp. LZ034LL]MDR5882748.1 hypothetical protein [Caballeronia sp. LZ032]